MVECLSIPVLISWSQHTECRDRISSGKTAAAVKRCRSDDDMYHQDERNKMEIPSNKRKLIHVSSASTNSNRAPAFRAIQSTNLLI